MSLDEARAIIERYAYRGVITWRQHEVVTLIAEGKSVPEIGEKLGIGVGTVGNHITGARLNVRVYEQRQKRRR